MAATTVNGKLLSPLAAQPASAQVTVTLVDYDDAPAVGFNTVDDAEILATDTIIPTSAGLWTVQLVPNANIQLTNGAAQTAYRITESGAGVAFTYWIIVTATSPAWAGSIRTTLVGTSGGTAAGMAVAGALTVGGETTLNGALTIPAGAANGDVWTSDAAGNGSWKPPPGGMQNPMTTLGDTLYQGASAPARLAGNTSAAKKFLAQTGTGTTSAAPEWDLLALTDLPPMPGVFDVTSAAYGAKGDGKLVVDGAMTSGSNVLACTISVPFVNSDAVTQKSVMVKGAGPLGVTTLVCNITGFTDNGHVTLSTTASTTITGATVLFANDDTAAFQSAVNAATSYAQAHCGYGKVSIPAPTNQFYGIAGALSHANLGNAQITLPVIPVTGDTITLEFEGMGTGNAIRHWLQTVPQISGSCLVSFGVYSSVSAQVADINANGNGAVIGGPTGPNGYGTATFLFSNMNVVFNRMSIVTTHSNFGLGYGAAWLWGVDQANIKDFGYGTTGVFNNGNGELGGSGVTTLSSGGSIGLGLPATSNQNNVTMDRVTCYGGYTFANAVPEHAVLRGCHIFYCWAGLGIVGSFHDGGGVTANTSSHGVDFGQIGIEGCSHSLYIFGSGASGIGPYCTGILDVESGLAFLDDGGNGLKNAIGEIKVRGTTGGTLSTSTNTGLVIVDERQPRGVGTPWSLTVGTAFMNPGGRWANVVISGGTNLTGIQLPTAELMWGPSAPPMSSWYSQASGPLPVITKRIPPGGWVLVAGTGSAPTVGVTYE